MSQFDYQSDRHCAKTVYLSTLYLGDEEARAIEIAERFVSNGSLPTINVIDRAGRPMPLKKKDAGLGS